MKRCLCLLVIVTLLIGCKKNNPASALSNPLPGNWELKSVQGGMLTDPSDTGKGNSLLFNQTEYLKYVNGQVVESGTYTLVKEPSFLNGEVLYRIVYSNQSGPKSYFRIENGELIIYYGAEIAVDGVIFTYQKGEPALSL